jgi:putative peptidoglycan lipid II flippase
VFTLLATQAMNLAFIGPFKHAGLALAIGLGACINAGLLYFQLRRGGIYTPQPGWWAFLAKLLAALVVMGAVLWFAMGPAEAWLQARAWVRAAHLSGLVAAGAASYFAVLFLLGVRPRDFAKRAAE